MKKFLSIIISTSILSACNNSSSTESKKDSASQAQTTKPLTRVAIKEHTKAGVSYLENDFMKLDTSGSAAVTFFVLVDDSSRITTFERFVIDTVYDKHGKVVSAFMNCNITIPEKYAKSYQQAANSFSVNNK